MSDFKEKVVIPAWATFGVRIEYKPANEYFKYPKILISEVRKDQGVSSGWKFHMRPFNENQKERGIYNAHCTIPFDALGPIISALVDVYKTYQDVNAPPVGDDAEMIAHRANHTEREDTLFRDSKDMAELEDPREPKLVPPGDPFEMIKKKGGGDAPGIPDADDSGNPDDYVPF